MLQSHQARFLINYESAVAPRSLQHLRTRRQTYALRHRGCHEHIPIPEALGIRNVFGCLGFCGSADANQPFEISLVSSMSPRGIRDLSSMDGERQGRIAMVVHS